TCWACSVVRSVQALYNISIPVVREQRELSVQHLVNNVTFDKKDGITNTKKAFNYIKNHGVCSSDQCKQQSNVVHQSSCRHGNERIYESVPDSLPSRGFHAVLLIGYGNHNGRPYWVVQNSWGSGWGFEGGFGYIYRQTKRGRRSVFTEVHYPTKKKRDRA
ncbi:hypothetical protein EUTSA_v10015311mg, partial [Eutrema salsugineum]